MQQNMVWNVPVATFSIFLDSAQYQDSKGRKLFIWYLLRLITNMPMYKHN